LKRALSASLLVRSRRTFPLLRGASGNPLPRTCYLWGLLQSLEWRFCGASAVLPGLGEQFPRWGRITEPLLGDGLKVASAPSSLSFPSLRSHIFILLTMQRNLPSPGRHTSLPESDRRALRLFVTISLQALHDARWATRDGSPIRDSSKLAALIEERVIARLEDSE